MDGKWHTYEGGGHTMRIHKPMKVDIDRLVSRETTDLSVPYPEYEHYHLDHVALYGQGIWVGVHKGTLDRRIEEPPGPVDSHVAMILKAILQRDVATELGI